VKVVFRADASIQIGTGHVMRCLTLAEELRRQGHECLFICRAHEGHLGDLISEKGFELHLLANSEPQEKSADYGPQLAHAEWLGCTWQKDAEQVRSILNQEQTSWLVVDHYALDANWEREVANAVGQIMVIDDLADRQHSCLLLLDQTFGRKPSDYFHWTPGACVQLCGAQYALLRTEFQEWRERSLERREAGKLGHIFVNLGGVDKDNITSRVLIALKACGLPSKTRFTVIMGSTAPWIDHVTALAAEMPWPTEVKVGVSNMAEVMASSDLAIGAAGSTIWERSCLGLPSFMVVIADNQTFAAKQLAQTGALEILTLDCDFEQSIVELIRNYQSPVGALRTMSLAAASITKGNGVSMVVKQLRRMGDINDN